MTAIDEACFDGDVALPRGTVTFLLTDLEDSTPAWDRAPEAMAKAVTRHYELLDEVVAALGGHRPEEQGEGDSVVAVFTSASDAAAAAVAAQAAFDAEPWPGGADLRVRMSVHTGEAELRDESNYFGQAIVRTARIRALAWGGQILLSGATAAIVRPRLPAGASLVDHGTHVLSGLVEPEQIWELSREGTNFDGIRVALEPARPSTLPEPLTPFIGRVDEITALTDALRQHRLITLNGVGGCGKTRIAIEAARALRSEFDDVVFVELATSRDDDAVVGAVAAALGVGGTDLGGVTRALQARRLLLVLDNCEQVLVAAASVTEQLLARAPDLVILATSRETLMVPGETSWRLASLGAGDAVALFLDRASRASASRTYAGDQRELVEQICTRLDGIPLAIELAAARAAALPLARLAGGLDDRFRLLTGGARTAVPRQQTLQASVDWSHDLLTATEKVVFRRLSVFSGGFALEAAEAVVAGEELAASDVMPGVMALADKSLVVLDDADRYHLLETLRHYGAQKLVEAGETTTVRDRHLRWAVDFLPPYWLFPGEDGWRPPHQIGPELPNLEAALDWTTDDLEAAHLGSVLVRQHIVRGNGAAAARSVRRLDTVPVDALDRDAFVNSLATRLVAAMELGDRDAQRQHLRALDELMAGVTDPLVRSVAFLALSFGFGGFSHSEEAVTAARAVGNVDRLAQSLSIRAMRQAMSGYFEQAAATLSELAQLVDDRPPLDAGGPHDGNGTMARAILALARGDGAFLMARPVFRLRTAGSASPRVKFFRAANDIAGSLYLARAFGNEAEAGSLLDAARRAGLALANTRASLVGAWELAHGDAVAGARTVVDNSVAAKRLDTTDLTLGLPVVQAYLVLGDNANARELLDTLRRRAERHAARFTPLLDQVEAQLALVAGDAVAAVYHAHAALAEAHARGLLPTVARCFERLAAASAMQAEWTTTARLVGAATHLREETLFGLLWPSEQTLLDDAVDAARAALGHGDFEAALAEGFALSFDDAVAYAQRARGERKRPTLGWAALTPTERQVADLAAGGLTNKEIGTQLLMGSETVKTHLSRVFAKIGLKNRTELARELQRRVRVETGSPNGASEEK